MPRSKRSINVTLCNSSKQLLRIQVKPRGGDFYMEEQQIALNPGGTVTLPKEYLLAAQVENLQARGMLKVKTEDNT